MKRVYFALSLLATAVSLSGCIVAPAGYYGRPHPGWCYYHPYRC